MRSAFVKALTAAAQRDPSLFLITADMGYSVLEEFEKKFPKQFLNVGIAEQNAVGFGAGMAQQGHNVFVYSIIPFITMRCFEQIRVDVAYQNSNLKLVGVGAGLTYGPAGATHHSIEDISLMRSLPGMRVLCPGDPVEAEALVAQAASLKGPCYIRLGKNGDPLVHEKSAEVVIGKITPVHSVGRDFLFLSTSNTLGLAKATCQKLEADTALGATLFSVHTIKPLDRVGLRKCILDTSGPIVTIEEHGPYGGLFSSIVEFLQEEGISKKVIRISLPDSYSHVVGSQDYLRKHFGLTAEGIIKKLV